MRLAMLADAGAHSLAVVHADEVIPLTALRIEFRDLIDLAEAGTSGLARIADALVDAQPGAGIPLATAVLGPVIERPGKIVAIGLNYRAHASEVGAASPDHPLIFAKFPTSILAPGGVISWDDALTDQVDYEAELGVVIGRRATKVGLGDALDFVLGYTCVNDITARDLQAADGQWVRAKSLDTFCPVGPVLVTRDEVPDPQTLRIRCLVNGEVRQDASTADMFFGVRELVSHCSQAFTLEPGDVLATGTPSGIGLSRKPPTFLRRGDEVIVEIEGIGRLVNRCG